MSVWMKSSSDVATDRMRSVASAWVIANDGPKISLTRPRRPSKLAPRSAAVPSG